MRCAYCNEDKPDVTIRRDPFAWEVNDKDVQEAMCDGCEQIAADDA
ncbi:hypothetical protein ABZ837_14815 [Streptomyces sp. NPDC047197]